MGLYFSVHWKLPQKLMHKTYCHCIFFAYSRDKYEELTLTDYLTLSQEILDELIWTVSYKGNSCHNFAIEEGHECLLKQKTSSPSHFRTVQLADFMAYVDATLHGVEHFVSKIRLLFLIIIDEDTSYRELSVV